MIGSTFKFCFLKKKINLNNVHENTPTINLKIEIKRCLMPTAKPNSSMFLFFQLRLMVWLRVVRGFRQVELFFGPLTVHFKAALPFL